MTNPRLLLLLLLAAVCGLAAGDSLIVVGSSFLVELEEVKDPETRYQLKKQYVISLTCSVRANSSAVLTEPSFKWERVGQNSSLDSRYASTDTSYENGRNVTSLLTLRRAVNEDIGNYTCRASVKGFPDVVGLAQMQSRPLISFQINHEDVKVSDVAVWSGESVVLQCLTEGNPVGSVEWLKDSVSLTNSSTLNLANVTYETDRGYFTCRSTNRFGSNSAKIFLRVKNPRAYQTPLFIFIAEIVVIGIIVGAYEFYMYKKRSKLDEQEGAAYKAD